MIAAVYAIAPHVVQSRNYNNETEQLNMVYIDLVYYIAYTEQVNVAVCAAFGKKRAENATYLFGSRKVCYDFILGGLLGRTHIHSNPVDCVDGNALIGLWQSFMQLTWLGAVAGKMAKKQADKTANCVVVDCALHIHMRIMYELPLLTFLTGT